MPRPAESQCLFALVDGWITVRAKSFLRRSYETARKKLKSIFAKTDTHRQTQLVALCRAFCQVQSSTGSLNRASLLGRPSACLPTWLCPIPIGVDSTNHVAVRIEGARPMHCCTSLGTL
jgi:DNA-binding CsgD family transcriptional regulator